MKETPIASKIKMVNLRCIEIFLKEKVGNLLINKRETKIVK